LFYLVCGGNKEIDDKREETNEERKWKENKQNKMHRCRPFHGRILNALTNLIYERKEDDKNTF
jgi:hypothetical protein